MDEQRCAPGCDNSTLITIANIKVFCVQSTVVVYKVINDTSFAGQMGNRFI